MNSPTISTYTLNCFGTALLKSACTKVYTCVFVLLVSCISLYKRVFRTVQMRAFFLAFLLLLAACGSGSSGAIRPTLPPFMPAPPKGGPPEFQEGWQDGCETGIGAHGNDMYRSTFKFRQNPSLVMNPVYYKAWKDAENYCRTYIFSYSFRNLDVWCSFDGLSDDCGDTTTNSVPFLGGSTEKLGYGFGGGGDVGAVMGGNNSDAPGMGGGEDGITGVMGAW